MVKIVFHKHLNNSIFRVKVSYETHLRNEELDYLNQIYPSGLRYVLYNI